MFASRLFIGNHKGQEGVGWHIQHAEGKNKNFQCRVLYSVKLPLKHEREMHIFTNK